MKIISNFRDYYDPVAAQGVDETIVYVREGRELPEDETQALLPLAEDALQLHFIEDEPPYTNAGPYFFESEPSVIFFCGELFAVLTLRFRDGEETRTVQAWDVATVEAEVPQVVLEALRYRDTPRRGKGWGFSAPRVHDFFAGAAALSSRIAELGHDLDAPVARLTFTQVYGGRARALVRGEANPCLMELGFASIRDPYRAFQELQGYISGVLGGRSPKMVGISDRDQRDKKGFDDMSFKTRPGTKKPRKKRK